MSEVDSSTMNEPIVQNDLADRWREWGVRCGPFLGRSEVEIREEKKIRHRNAKLARCRTRDHRLWRFRVSRSGCVLQVQVRDFRGRIFSEVDLILESM